MPPYSESMQQFPYQCRGLPCDYVCFVLEIHGREGIDGTLAARRLGKVLHTEAKEKG